MKRNLLLFILLIAGVGFAQNGINYKALIKDGLGNVVVNQTIDVQFMILQGASQTNVYEETHSVMTDANGILIVNIGEGNSADDFTTINWGSEPSFLNVQIDTGSGLVDLGTSEFKTVPYALHAQNSSGLIALDEGNGTGWHLKGRNPDNYGVIGNEAVDLSFSNGASLENGATANFSLASGVNVIADDLGATVVGRYNDHTSSTSTLFQVGNGNIISRSNAFVVESNGVITAPSFSLADITNTKALVTKEYVDTNASSGLEAINEGNGMGWRLVDVNPNNYGSIGINAVDLSISNTPSSISGATGAQSFSLGTETRASNFASTAIGYRTNAIGQFSTAIGSNTTASGNTSTAMGYNTIADDLHSLTIGAFNDNTSYVNALFQVGNGSNGSSRSNAFTVLRTGNALLAGTLTQSSDRRLKTNISEMTYGLKEVLKLKPVEYHWRRFPNQPKSLGLIAQDVQPIINEIVHTSEDKDKTLSVSYIELIPVLVKAIQEQQDIISIQNSKITDLKVLFVPFLELV